MANSLFQATSSEVIPTTTIKKIRRLLAGTAKRSQFSTLFGPTGRGKTLTATDWVRTYGNAAYLRARTGSTLCSLRKQLSRAIFDGDESAREPEILRYIADHPGFVLIVDEATHLIMDANLRSAKNLDYLRDFHDEATENGCRFGICFIFTNYSLERLGKSRIGEFLRQFINRCDNHLDIDDKISRAREIIPTLQALLGTADVPKDMIDLACEINDMRALHKRFAVARELSEQTHRPLDAEMLRSLQEQYKSGRYPDE